MCAERSECVKRAAAEGVVPARAALPAGDQRMTTLRLERPPIHVAVNLEGTADLDLASGTSVLLHTEQAGYTPAPRPPAFTAETVSFSRPGAVVVQGD